MLACSRCRIMEKDRISGANKLVFEESKVILYYGRLLELTTAESTILRDHQDAFVNKHVLDLGVGAGRTVPSLAPFAASYVGIDYSLGMIDVCRARFPKYQFEHGDARDLSRFSPGTFDSVLFSFNGIDCVGHTDRLTILAEVARVLAPGGIFAFSSHSLQRRLRQSFWPSLMSGDGVKTPFQRVKHAARIARRLANYLRYADLQVQTKDYAALLDPGHDFRLPIYCVSPSQQCSQLRDAGFDDPKIFAEQHEEYYDEGNPYAFYYVARTSVS